MVTAPAPEMDAKKPPACGGFPSISPCVALSVRQQAAVAQTHAVADLPAAATFLGEGAGAAVLEADGDLRLLFGAHLFFDLVRSGKTIVMVTHDVDLAKRATRTVLLVDGHIASRNLSAADFQALSDEAKSVAEGGK